MFFINTADSFSTASTTKVLHILKNSTLKIRPKMHPLYDFQLSRNTIKVGLNRTKKGVKKKARSVRWLKKIVEAALGQPKAIFRKKEVMKREYFLGF